MILVNGKKLAEEIKEELKLKVKDFFGTKKLGIIYIGSDPVIDSFIKIKRKFAEEIGVDFEIFKYDEDVDEEFLSEEIKNKSKVVDGLVIQLPIPNKLNLNLILDSMLKEKDIDVLGGEAIDLYISKVGKMIPPVAGAVEYILDYYDINLNNKKILVLGNGRLVGKPISFWLEKENLDFEIMDKNTVIDLKNKKLEESDVIISGMGDPHSIKVENIKKDVILIDAGTSESNKKIVGDIDPECMKKAFLFTPVPGGVGPLTVAILFRNLICHFD